MTVLVQGEHERASPDTVQEVTLYRLWGDYFHGQRVKLRIANVGNGRQARVRTALLSAETGKVNSDCSY